jgi:hypothetical protein
MVHEGERSFLLGPWILMMTNEFSPDFVNNQQDCERRIVLCPRTPG